MGREREDIDMAESSSTLKLSSWRQYHRRQVMFFGLVDAEPKSGIPV
jgi:hypothetical protein